MKTKGKDMKKSLLRMLVVLILTVAIVFGAIMIFDKEDPKKAVYNNVVNSATYKTENNQREYTGISSVIGTYISSNSAYTYTLGVFDSQLTDLMSFYLERLNFIQDSNVSNNVKTYTKEADELLNNADEKYQSLKKYVKQSNANSSQVDEIVKNFNNRYISFIVKYLELINEVKNYSDSAVYLGNSQATVTSTMADLLLDYASYITSTTLSPKSDLTLFSTKANNFAKIYAKFSGLKTSISVETNTENFTSKALQFAYYYDKFNFKTDMFSANFSDSYANQSSSMFGNDALQKSYAQIICSFVNLDNYKN